MAHYLAYREFEAVLGQTSINTVEPDVVVTAPSSSLFSPFVSTSCCSSGFPAAGCGSGEVGDAGDAGEAGETGDGGEVGEVGEGGDRGGDGRIWLACASPSRLSWLSGSTGDAGGSLLFSALLVRSSSCVGGCFWASMLRLY